MAINNILLMKIKDIIKLLLKMILIGSIILISYIDLTYYNYTI